MKCSKEVNLLSFKLKTFFFGKIMIAWFAYTLQKVMMLQPFLYTLGQS